MKKINSVYLILHNIRSVHNVGAIFRTADAISVEKIYLTGYTPSPIDKYGKHRKDLSKTALGSEKTILWEKNKNISSVITSLKKEGFNIVAIEQTPNSLDYKRHKPDKKSAFLLGNEVKGLSAQTLSKVDAVLEISMKGEKESLNVSVACGVVLFRLFDVK